MPESTCTVPQCAKRRYATGLCSMHYSRQKRYGTTSDDALQRKPNIGACLIDDCESPSRKRGWCGSHYAQWHATGEAKPFKHKWSDRTNCLVCGEPCTQRGRRRYCSARCQVLVSRHGMIPPMVANCTQCGVEIDVSINPETNRKKRSDTGLCVRCRKAKGHRHGVSVSTLNLRDGNQCTICCKPIDLNLFYPNPMSPSVDHVVPYALGGAHSIENLALAHLTCNHIKHKRVGWSMT